LLKGLGVVAELYVALAASAAFFFRLRVYDQVSNERWLMGCLITAIVLSFPSRWIGNDYAFTTVVFAAIFVGIAYHWGVPVWFAARVGRFAFALIFVGCGAAAVLGNVRWLSVFASMALLLLSVTFVNFGSAESEDERRAQDSAFVVACVALAGSELMLDLKWHALAWCSLLTMRVTRNSDK
jgi:hypothetical protein